MFASIVSGSSSV